MLAIIFAIETSYVPIYDAMPAGAVILRPVRELEQISWMVGKWRETTFHLV